MVRRQPDEVFASLIIDTTYETIRQAGIVRSWAVLVALGADWEGRRQTLVVDLANSERLSSRKDVLVGMRDRGLHRVEHGVASDHSGLRTAVQKILPDAWFYRRYLHFLRNTLDLLSRKPDDVCPQKLRWIYDCRDLCGAKSDLAAWSAM